MNDTPMLMMCAGYIDGITITAGFNFNTIEEIKNRAKNVRITSVLVWLDYPGDLSDWRDKGVSLKQEIGYRFSRKAIAGIGGKQIHCICIGVQKGDSIRVDTYDESFNLIAQETVAIDPNDIFYIKNS